MFYQFLTGAYSWIIHTYLIIESLYKTHLWGRMFSQHILENVTQEILAILPYESQDVPVDFIKWYYNVWNTLNVLF